MAEVAAVMMAGGVRNRKHTGITHSSYLPRHFLSLRFLWLCSTPTIRDWPLCISRWCGGCAVASSFFNVCLSVLYTSTGWYHCAGCVPGTTKHIIYGRHRWWCFVRILVYIVRCGWMSFYSSRQAVGFPHKASYQHALRSGWLQVCAFVVRFSMWTN